MKTISVLLCDDHTGVREGLRLLLNKAADIHVLGEAENGRLAVQETKRLRPDVVLLDLSMPVLDGIEAARQIASAVPSARVLILSAYADGRHVQQAVEAGAAGYLTKGTCAKELLQAIRAISRGKTFFSTVVTQCFVKQQNELFHPRLHAMTRASTLTRRQTEILKLLAEGFANKEMASLLSVSVKTIEKHRQEVMDKLRIHCTAALTRYAVSMGLLDPAVPPHWRAGDSAAPPRLNEHIAGATNFQSN